LRRKVINLFLSLKTDRVIKNGESGGENYMQQKMRNAYKILICKPKGKTPFGRQKSRWENNIKMDIQEIRCRRVD
jgi:hypothetical protein